MRVTAVLLLICLAGTLRAQPIEENTFLPNIASVKLYPYGNQTGYPILTLGSSERLELHFDDLDADVKNYYYTFQLCNADWTPAILNSMDFIKGFSQTRISTYRNASIALTRYTHYQAELPDRNMVPSRSGNYILKVYLNGDTSKMAFTKRFLVVQPVAKIAAHVQQPFNGNIFRTHQKIQFSVNIGSLQASVPNQQVKVFILQNNRWDNAVTNLVPTFVRQNVLEYNTEQQAVFPAGREWRWLDLRSFRLQSDRVSNANYKPGGTELFLRPDPERKELRSAFYRDNNGMCYIQPMESVNPFWQGDYATVHFKYVPKNIQAYRGKELLLFGELTNYGKAPGARMIFNEESGFFETSLFLKQGYYDYEYVLKDSSKPNLPPDVSITEGDNWETENVYTILVYFRAFGGRVDELVGIEKVNSLQGRTGVQ